MLDSVDGMWLQTMSKASIIFLFRRRREGVLTRGLSVMVLFYAHQVVYLFFVLYVLYTKNFAPLV